MDIFWLIAGLLLILVGADMLTDGASALARRWGVGDLIVGLTVVAFGTSAPELSISLVSALRGNAPMAIGNVVGSNIFNVFAIIGVVALIKPIAIGKSIMTNEIPLTVLASCALLAIGCSDILEGGIPRMLTRTDGILLLLFLAVFMRYTFAAAKSNPSPSADPASADAGKRCDMPIWKASLWVVAGLAALVWGGDRFVAGASGMASALGVSDAVIGLTIVAAGTSLPELAASGAAALKGQTGIAVGNVIGSNILNIFLVLGLTGTIRPLPFGGVSTTDLLVMTAASLLFWLFGWKFGKQTITRGEGAFLTACYVGYVVFQITSL